MNHLDRPFVRSVFWQALGKWSVQLATWASTIAMARMLTAKDYGIFGMAGLFRGLVALLAEMGVGAAVVNLRDLTDEQIAQMNGFAVLVGTAACLLTLVLAYPLGAFFHSAELPAVMMVLSTTFIITGARAVPTALLQRSLRFRELAMYEASGSIASAVVGVGLAALGFGYWALIAGFVTAAVVSAALTGRAGAQGFAFPRLSSVRTALSFSGKVVTGRVAWFAYSNSDFLVAGRVLGATALGVYSFGWNLTNLAIDKIATLVNSVTPAFFSSLQSDAPALRRMLLAVTEALALAVLPVTIGFALVAPDLFPLVFGAKWAPAVPVVQLLSVYGVLRALRPVQNNVLVALGDVDAAMWISIGSAVIFPLGFLVGSKWGPTGIAAVWAVLYPISMGVGYARLFRLGVVTPRDYFASVWPALSAVAVMAAAVLATRAALSGVVPRVVTLAASVAVGAAAYGLTLLLAHRPRIERFLRLARGMRGGLTTT